MAKRIYVGNLPSGTDEAKIKDLFAQHGEVTDVRVITDMRSGRASGFGFVEMADDATADVAIEKLNGTALDGATLIVNEARPRR